MSVHMVHLIASHLTSIHLNCVHFEAIQFRPKKLPFLDGRSHGELVGFTLLTQFGCS